MDRGSELYRLFINGDGRAFEDIIKEYRDCVTKFIATYVRNIDISEELAMDTFAELIVSPGKFKFKCSLKTYLFTIGKNKAIDYIRKNKNYTAELNDNIQYYSPECFSPEETLLNNYNKSVINKCLSSLTKDYRTALYLVYFESLSYKETAKVMKKTEKQVTNLVYRGKRALKEILEKERVRS